MGVKVLGFVWEGVWIDVGGYAITELVLCRNLYELSEYNVCKSIHVFKKR